MRSNASLRTLPLVVVSLASAALAGCAGSAKSDSGGHPPTGSGPGPGSTGAAGSGASDPGTAATNGHGGVQSGLLTAGAWDDNANFDFYLRYLRNSESGQAPGLPVIPRANRLEVRVTDGAGKGIGNATVTITGAAGPVLEAPTRSDGRLFFFPGTVGAEPGEPLQIAVKVGSQMTIATAHVGDAAVPVVVTGATGAPPTALDLALVIDTTGSMGDEIDYLKAEVKDISARVAADFPNVAQRWALILYRDDGDEYVVRSFDFTDSLTTFQSRLAAQSAGGGGDYPEAPEKALSKLTTLSFSQNGAARMAFWLADAPHHVGREGTMVNDVLLAQRLGIHLYPIAASGADDLVEYTMRTAAEVTGGRYLFLTDDSGIGGSHDEPTIPCYFVTSLSHAMIRMAAMELTGTNIDVAPADVIRTSGDPIAGKCALSDGGQVSVL
jgi:hypothetical protein